MSELICQSCSEPKAQLQRVSSNIIKSWKLNMCRGCIQLGYEPRFLIILAANQDGLNELVSEYLRKRRYVGPDIPAAEVL